MTKLLSTCRTIKLIVNKIGSSEMLGWIPRRRAAFQDSLKDRKGAKIANLHLKTPTVEVD
jgi:hypothetical protein